MPQGWSRNTGFSTRSAGYRDTRFFACPSEYTWALGALNRAGGAGELLVRGIERHLSPDCDRVQYVDDDQGKQGKRIHDFALNLRAAWVALREQWEVSETSPP